MSTTAKFAHHAKAVQLVASMNKRVLHCEPQVKLVTLTMLAGGHALLRGEAGSGKTHTAEMLEQLIGGEATDHCEDGGPPITKFSRFQGAANNMAPDILGTEIMRGRDFDVAPGPVFTHFLLCDEINRNTPRTTNAMLEAMQSRTVTISGVTRRTFQLPKTFFVIGTRNLILEGSSQFDLEGPLADRFTGEALYPSPDENQGTQITMDRLRREANGTTERGIITHEEILAIRKDIENSVALEESLVHYGSRLCCHINPNRNEKMKQHVLSFTCTRSTFSIAIMARAMAYLEGSNCTTPEHVREVLAFCVRHRITMQPMAEHEEWTVDRVIATALENVKPII